MKLITNNLLKMQNVMPKSLAISRRITTINLFLNYSGLAAGGVGTDVTAGTDAVELFAESVL
jgi:hypothetical protein